MSNLKEIPITREIERVIIDKLHPEFLFRILFKYENSNVSREVFDTFLAKIIFLCAMHDNADVLKYMILWGGDPDRPLSAVVRTEDNRTALNIARDMGSRSVEQYLLTRPAEQADLKRYLEDVEVPIGPENVKLLPGRRENPDFLRQKSSNEIMDRMNAAKKRYYNGLGGKRRRSRRRTMRKKKTRRYRR